MNMSVTARLALLERKAVILQQQQETSAREQTANLEDHIDMQRSLFAHQTAR